MRLFTALFILFFWAEDIIAQDFSMPFTATWEFRKLGDQRWNPAEVPGTVHTDLLANRIIADPFYRDNEKNCQWVEKEDWEYRARFTPGPALFSKQDIKLVFDGLDTYAKVWLNGSLILETNNMFRQWKTGVKKWLKEKNNELRIVFYSAVRHDDSLASLSAIRLAGENNRMYSRKAQYQYGWDWGPRLVTCGIWKPVHWEAGNVPGSKILLPAKQWNVELITRPDPAGQSFYFTRNGKPEFIKGANWIPCESFLPRARKSDRYRQLILAAKEAHINMLRVWGGGVYEDDEFYELCDHYGIMVWQDFMFAGALYPGDEQFVKNVEAEIRYQVTRLRRHPCIVLWCGNNEIDEAWHNWGWQQEYHYSPGDSARLWKDYQHLFLQLIPGILKELDPSRPYWPSSPSIGWGRTEAYHQGDVHYWGVWWGKEPVEKYNEKVGRFNSEYGMQGFPSMATIKKFSLPAEMDTSSDPMRAHQKHPFGYENIKLYIGNRFRTPKTFEDLVYVSQLMQADAIKTAIEAHRRNMPVTMGTMFWQWDDCWPAISWSAVDYYLDRKALYYEVKRSYAPFILSIGRGDDGSRKLFCISDLDTTLDVTWEARAIDFSGKELGKAEGRNPQKLEPRKSFSIGFPESLDHPADRADYFILFTVRNKGNIMARAVYFLVPPRELNLSPAKIAWKWLPGNRLELISGKFAYGVFIELPGSVKADDNYFHLLPGEKKIIRFSGSSPDGAWKNQLRIRSLADTY